ncbi:MAG: hypothetical protein WC180_06415 [Candidatus Paceibacterota bacterium]
MREQIEQKIEVETTEIECRIATISEHKKSIKTLEKSYKAMVVFQDAYTSKGLEIFSAMEEEIKHQKRDMNWNITALKEARDAKKRYEKILSLL